MPNHQELQEIPIADVLVEEKLLCRDPSGRTFAVTVQIGQPYGISPKEWGCPVALYGMVGRLPDVTVHNKLMALAIAMQLPYHLLSAFVSRGGQVFLDGESPEDQEEGLPPQVSLDVLFGRVSEESCAYLESRLGQ